MNIIAIVNTGRTTARASSVAMMIPAVIAHAVIKAQRLTIAPSPTNAIPNQ
ncbi:hypothetical protein PYL83_00940 [Moraxella lacunata]|uniref:hypothetical protein n=1 Tax=Moraxella TaxID=475 RepID=UPI001EF539A9|nr:MULTISPECIES: hypothetical protein [Moraxella]MCG7412592.1 hypothetical protein [Moraxella nonliquefaciens]MDH9217811.1 hypothetical protein [Moraxella lacunata]